MFKRLKLIIKNFLGGKTGMYKTLDKVTDHPDIRMTDEEMQRIFKNKEFYKDDTLPIVYHDSNGDQQQRDKNTVNLSKLIAKKLAKLVFNEGVTITASDEKNSETTHLQDKIDEILEANKFQQVFGEELEGGYAVSGLAIVPNFDVNTGTVKFVYCSADNFIPLDGNTNVVTEAALINHYREVKDNTVIYYTLFAIHKKTDTGYKIEHELYRSADKDVVGQQVSLETIDATADLSDTVTLDGLTKPLFVYIKLAGKNNINYGSPLGLGVIDNAYRQLCNFNDKYDLYMNEIDTATRQLVASASFFDVKYDRDGRPKKVFNPKTQIWQKVQDDDGNILEEFAPAIRSAQYIESLNFILRIIEQEVGFSSGTISFDGKSFKTATEVISENTDTYQTRSDNVLIVQQAIKDLISNSLYLIDYYDETFTLPELINIDVDFDDGVFVSKTDRLSYIGTGITFGIMSKKTAMIKAYGLSEEQADKELEQINNEVKSRSPITSEVYTDISNFGIEE